MNKYTKVKFSITTFLLILTSTFGQNEVIKVRFIGNAGLHITDDKQNIYIDFPYVSGAHNYMEYDESELDSIRDNSIFLFTHRHKDHYSKKLLKNINGKKYGNWNIEELKNIKDSSNNFSIKATKTSHKFSLKHYSYLITWHQKRIFISGDIESTDVLKELKNVDWAFLNSWVFLDSIVQEITIDAKMLGIYHLRPNVKIGKKFAKNVRFLNKQNELILIDNKI